MLLNVTVTSLPSVEATTLSPTKFTLLTSVVKLLPSSFTVILAAMFDKPLPSPLNFVASTLPKEPVETPEPLTSVTVPSLNSVMSVAILDCIELIQQLEAYGYFEDEEELPQHSAGPLG